MADEVAHYQCPGCGQFTVEFMDPPTEEVKAHCYSCNTDFPYVYQCAVCGQPVFGVMPWDPANGNPVHPECAGTVPAERSPITRGV